MDRAHSGIDWQGLEEYFVKHTPADMSLRDFADNVTPSLPETNHKALHYEVIKDEAKRNYWMRKRAKYLIEQNPGLRRDTEVIYGILRAKLIDGSVDLNPTELTRLAVVISDYQEILQAGEPLTPDMEGQDRITKDDVLTIVREEVEIDRRAMFMMAEDIMHAKSPV